MSWRSFILTLAISLLLGVGVSPLSRAQCEVAEIHPGDAAGGDAFGLAVASRGRFALMSAPARERDDGSGSVFVWRKMGGRWQPGPVWERGWNFGVVLDMTENRAVVGGSSMAAVYRHEGLGWIFETELQGGDPPPRYGESVAIDGDLILVGAYQAQMVLAYRWNGSAWEQEEVLTPDSWSSEFGRDVAASGDLAIIGAPGDNAFGGGAGAVWIYRYAQGHWQIEDKLMASDGRERADLGSCVAVEGDVVVAGAPGDDDEGAVYLFRQEAGAWREVAKLTSPTPQRWSRFGGRVVLQGSRLVVAAPLMESSEGLVFLFEELAGRWILQATCRARNTSDQDLFGWEMALNGDDLLVGAPHDNESGPFAGAVYQFDVGADVGGSRDSYGEGWPGTLGVPRLSADRDPLLCAGLALLADNSRGRLTIGFLVLGTQPVELETPAGATLLVLPKVVYPLAIPSVGLVWPVQVPCDPLLEGVEIDGQMIEVDPGAIGGFSFTPGLRLVSGSCPPVR